MALHTAVVVAFSGEKPEFHSADDPPIATWNWFYYSSVALTHSCMMAMITLLRVWVSPRRRLTGAIVKVSLYLCVPLLFIAEMLVCGVGWERWGFANLGPTPNYCEALIRHEIPWEYVYKPYVAVDNSTAASGDSSASSCDVGRSGSTANLAPETELRRADTWSGRDPNNCEIEFTEIPAVHAKCARRADRALWHSELPAPARSAQRT